MYTPGGKLAGNQMAAVLDLYAEEPVLGRDSRFVREAGVVFGKATVAPVGDDELPLLARRRPDLRRWRFTAVAVPFDLQDLPVGRRYTEASLRMAFADRRVCALQLGQQSPGGRDAEIEVSTWGVGLSALAWRLTARDDELGIRPGGRVLLAVVESPLDAARLSGTLDASVRFSRMMLGIASQAVAEARLPLPFVLDVAEGGFEISAGQ